MKVKHYLTSITLAVLMVSCSKSSGVGAYTINGTAEGVEDGTVVVLYDRADNKLAETTINGEQFTISGTTDSLMAVVLRTNNRAVGSTAYLEAGTIDVDLIQHIATGTPLNDEGSAATSIIDAVLGQSGINEDSIINAIYSEIYPRHPNDPLGLTSFLNAAYFMSYDEMKTAMSQLGPVITQNPRVEKMLRAKQKEGNTAVGSQYVDISGQDANNPDTTLRLSDIIANGKPTLVDFWASWCGPCRQETPIVGAAARKYADRINVVGIAVWDQMPDTQQAIKELGITWPVIFNERQATDDYGVQGIPHILLIDGEGRIVARELRGPAIEAAIETVLK